MYTVMIDVTKAKPKTRQTICKFICARFRRLYIGMHLIWVKHTCYKSSRRTSDNRCGLVYRFSYTNIAYISIFLSDISFNYISVKCTIGKRQREREKNIHFIPMCIITTCTNGVILN